MNIEILFGITIVIASVEFIMLAGALEDRKNLLKKIDKLENE